MDLFSEKAQCCGCMACVDACPQHAVTLKTDSEGFLYPYIQQEFCTDCKRCKTVCPLPRGESRERIYKCFAAQAKAQTLRESSASGAVFPVLAETVLENGGAVYGAAFDSDMYLVHQRIDNRNELAPLMQSKYIQSKTVGVFRSIKADLEKRKQVLFVGTPCQAEAVRRFLGREYANLLLVDLICYGVPSPGVWAQYIRYLGEKHEGKLTTFRFRDKRFHDGYTMSYKIDGKEYLEKYSQNPYISMYFSNCMLRPSCHTCPFTTLERSSDITIGDSWGIEKICSEMDDGMGTSLVILHSIRGSEIWEKLQDKFYCKECNAEEILQPRLISPSQPARKRQLFWRLYRKLPFSVMSKLFVCKLSRRFWYAGRKP